MGLGHVIRVWKSKRREAKKAKERPADVTRAQHQHVLQFPNCAACGCAAHVQGHHIRPWHLAPELGAAASNFISLCMGELECHLRIGHGGNFDCWNPNVQIDARASLNALGAGDRATRQGIEARASAGRLK